MAKLIGKNKGQNKLDRRHYEYDATPLEGRKETADILGEVSTYVEREFEGRTLNVSRSVRWEKVDTIEGTLQSYSQKIGKMSAVGHRGFKEKVFATANNELLKIGGRVRIRKTTYTIFNIDREIVAGFSMNYLKEVK